MQRHSESIGVALKCLVEPAAFKLGAQAPNPKTRKP